MSHKILALLIVLLTFCSCKGLVTDLAYRVTHEVVYTNNSNHSINIVCDSQYYQYPCELEISQGEMECMGIHFLIPGITADQIEAKIQKLIIPEMVTLVFDDEYSITFSRGAEMDNLCNISDYICKLVNVTHKEWHYTFTEADYEYAKENGTRIEKE